MTVTRMFEKRLINNNWDFVNKKQYKEMKLPETNIFLTIKFSGKKKLITYFKYMNLIREGK